LRKWKNVFIYGNFYAEFERYVKEWPSKQAALSKGALLWNIKGVPLLGLLREKDNAHLGSFFLCPNANQSIRRLWCS
jgi:hypothetical protein